MTALIAGLVVSLAWSVGRARGGGRRRPISVRAGSLAPVGWRLQVWRQRAFGSAAVADPAPLLRFRSAIERGASVPQALEAVATGAGAWSAGARRAVHRIGAGSAVQDAVDAWASEGRDRSIQLLADALAISTATGGSHLRAVDAVIDAVRDRGALQREVRALASQAQTSAVVLVLLPIGFALAVAVLDARVRAFYIGSALGPVCVGIGVVLDLLGALIMVRLVRSVA